MPLGIKVIGMKERKLSDGESEVSQQPIEPMVVPVPVPVTAPVTVDVALAPAGAVLGLALAATPGVTDGIRTQWKRTAGQGYLDRLVATPQPDGRTWITQARFRWRDDEGRIYTVPKLFITDFASVPLFLPTVLAGIIAGSAASWIGGTGAGFLAGILVAILGLSPYGSHQWAAVFHDYLYRSREVTRAEADRVFFLAMGSAGVYLLKRLAMYAAVRCFGWWGWRSHLERSRYVLTAQPAIWKSLPPRGIEKLLLTIMGRGRT